LPPMFERDEPQHCTAFKVDPVLFEELQNGFKYVEYTTILQPLFEAIRAQDPLQAAERIPRISKETVRIALGLEYDIEEFLLYNIVEGFLAPNKQSRLDKETNAPLRPDLGQRAAGVQMCAQYVQERYQVDYERRLKQQSGEEKAIVVKDVVSRLVHASDMPTFRGLLKNGVTCGVVSHTLANVNSLGCKELEESLLDLHTTVPCRAKKLGVYYTGCTVHEAPVWNGGNVIRAPPAVKEILTKLGEEAMWDHIQQAMKRSLHCYRNGLNNRHGHSNELPSYWANGHSSLCSFAKACDAATWAQYKSQHRHCCGMAGFLATEEAYALLGNSAAHPAW